MPDLIIPLAVSLPPPPPGSRPRYDWSSAADGTFYQWRDAPDTEDPDESHRAYSRLRLSALRWAARRGGSIETRVRDRGRQVWIAIYLPDSQTP